MKLNLGCGTDIRKDYINVDCISNDGVDIVMDLNNKKIKFKTDSINEILARDIIEHLDNPVCFIEELHRICKHNAIIYIKAPHFSSNSTWSDLTHKRALSSTVFYSYNFDKKKTSSLLCKNTINFKIKSRIIFHKIQRLFLIEKIVNINDFTKWIYERFFAYIFQSAFIKFELCTIKNIGGK